MTSNRDPDGDTESPSRAESRTVASFWVGLASGWPSRRRVLTIVAVALVVRLICATGSSLVGADSPRFLAAAQHYADGEAYEAFLDDYHPLAAYSFSLSLRVAQALFGVPDDLRAVQRQRERSAIAVSMLAGLIVVIGLMGCTNLLFPAFNCEVVGWLATFQPYLVRASTDIMSDAVFTALFVLALYHAAVVARDRRLTTALVTGGCVGLAYLARPEALIMLPAIGLYWLVVERRPRRLTLLYAGLAATTVLLVFPYMLALHDAHGEWLLTRKKSLSDLLGLSVLGFGGPCPAPFASAPSAIFDGRALYRIWNRWFMASPEVLASAAMIGFWCVARRREWRRGHVLFLSAAVLLIGVLLLLLRSVGDYNYVTKRHVMALTVLSMPFAARGVFGFSAGLQKRWPRYSKLFSVPFVLAGVLLATGVKAVAPQRLDQLAQRDAAEFILKESGPGACVFTSREKVSYYCCTRFRSLESEVGRALEDLTSRERAWLAFYRERRPELAMHLRELGRELRTADGRLRGTIDLIESFPEPYRNRTLDVYQWIAAPKN